MRGLKKERKKERKEERKKEKKKERKKRRKKERKEERKKEKKKERKKKNCAGAPGRNTSIPASRNYTGRMYRLFEAFHTPTPREFSSEFWD
jgi:hypothetical protein